MPFVNVSLLRHLTTLVTGYDAVVPLIPSPNTGQAEWEPLHAVYRQSCLPAIEACLSANRRRTVSFLRDVRTRAVLAEEILPFDPDLLSFRNVNTPEDLERARTILRALGE
jgi:molybdopterin-guanine dinucleotide biosynthesis protein A